MNQPSFVLIVEDDPSLGPILQRALAQQFRSPESAVLLSPTLAQTRDLLNYVTPELVILDLRLPDSEEGETLAAMRALLPDVPLIVLSGYYSSIEGLAAIQAGADDYVLKGVDTVTQLLDASSKAWARALHQRVVAQR